MVGKTVSHYRILRQLGAGGMGVVYAAEDPRLNRQVALKFVPDDLAHDPHTLARLRSEARTASGLNHPNICTIYDIGEFEGRPFIVMELLKGQTLRERMEAGRLKIQEAVDIGIQASDALFWAHSKDVIHRDIKPANLFLCDQGPLKILDFGLAKVVAPQPGLEATLAPTVDLTAVGVAVGTVAYMSPEQVGGDRLDRRTDLFSLGVVLYECVTGRQPFQGKTSAVILASILTQQPTPPRELNGNIPVGLQDAIHACLEKDRELRYQDAGSLRADLKRVKRDLDSGALGISKTTTVTAELPDLQSSISTTQVPVRPPSGTTVTTAVAPVRRNRGLVIGLSVAAVALAAAGVAVTMFRGSSAPPPAPQTAAAVPTPVAPPPQRQPQPSADDAADAARRRAEAARFDEAIVDGNRFLAAGDADGASRALSIARAINPSSPAVADLSARLVEFFRAASARRPPADAPRSAPSNARGAAVETRAPRPNPAPSAAAVAPPSPPPAPPAPAADAPTPDAAQTARGQTGSDAARPPAVELPAPAPPPRPEPAERRATAPPATAPPAAAPTTPVEDDDAAIRRLVASYGRAIETKDIGLFRTLKPNLSPAERRTIEDGFRAVTSQQVTFTILSIDRQGPEAFVRLRRHDVIEVSGRQRTVDNEQTLRLFRSPAGWVILRIGR